MQKSQKGRKYTSNAAVQLDHRQEIVGIFWIALAVFLIFSNYAQTSSGVLGKWMRALMNFFVGDGRFVLPYFLMGAGFFILTGDTYTRKSTRIPGLIGLLFAYLAELEYEHKGASVHYGGIIGRLLAGALLKLSGVLGLKIGVIACALICLLLIFKVTLMQIIRFIAKVFVVIYIWVYDFMQARFEEMEKEHAQAVALSMQRKGDEPGRITAVASNNEVKKRSKKEPELIITSPSSMTSPPPLVPLDVEKNAMVEAVHRPAKEEAEVVKLMPLEIFAEDEDFELPPLSLLSEAKVAKDHQRRVEEEIRLTTRKLEETLDSFKVNARVVGTCQGPTVTRYEVQPGFGVKVSKIVNLADDIALNLAAKGVRIEAPVPGKSVVGIEIPNSTSTMVSLLPLVRDERFRYSTSPLNICLGKDIEGKSVFIDLTRMPHLLVAGATGAGKSVCINSIILSLLFRNTPSTVRMIMIDPKKVELSVYDDIPHLIAPVVTDPKKAAVTLRWCVKEMERRYEELASAGVRNIEGYNQRIEEMIAHRLKLSEEEQKDFFIPRKYAYIVVVIDELADLMLAAASEVETSIARIAQMARAVGIHLVIATQRPSVDVITGLIKANVPSRISFAVASQIDSRTILDSMGAEKLLGKGDMLYKPVGAMQPIRAQGVFVAEKEVHQVIKYVKDQGKPEYLQEVVNLKPEDLENMNSGSSDSGSSGDYDEFYEEARELVVTSKVASISYIQRKLRIGYNRAARIMEQLEEAGVVSPPDSDGKNRQVLMGMME